MLNLPKDCPRIIAERVRYLYADEWQAAAALLACGWSLELYELMVRIVDRPRPFLLLWW
jgi:hypothetical protein